MKLSVTAREVGKSIKETLTYMDYSTEHLNWIHANNTMEQIGRNFKRCTKASDRNIY